MFQKIKYNFEFGLRSSKNQLYIYYNSQPRLILTTFFKLYNAIYFIGGFAIVYLVKASNGNRYALKRMYVNNEQDLNVAKREIQIAVSIIQRLNFLNYL